MNSITIVKGYKVTGLVILLGLSVLLIGCGGGVSAEEIQAVKGELLAAQDQMQGLQNEVLTLSLGAASGFGQVSSVADLTSARGVVYGYAETWDEKNGTREWLVNGEWSLDCQVACAKAEPEQVQFDMAFAMVRPDGKSSHGHTWWGFESRGVEVVPGDKEEALEIKGTITGSGPISTGGITIKLVKKDVGHFTFFFQLAEGNVLKTEVGGSVLESNGS